MKLRIAVSSMRTKPQLSLAEMPKPENLYKLESVGIDDTASIQIKDGGKYKDSASLSTGQKRTAILPILLFDSANPLLIDQPEENLENIFVFGTVVQRRTPSII